MALPNQVLPGFAASLWCQTGASPTALTLTQLSTWTIETVLMLLVMIQFDTRVTLQSLVRLDWVMP